MPILPNRERLCRSIKKLAKNKEDTRLLWEEVLRKTRDDLDNVTSTTIETTWSELLQAGTVQRATGGRSQAPRRPRHRPKSKKSAGAGAQSRGKRSYPEDSPKPKALVLRSQPEFKPAGSSDAMFSQWADLYSADLPSPVTPNRMQTRAFARNAVSVEPDLFQTPITQGIGQAGSYVTPNTEGSFYSQPQFVFDQGYMAQQPDFAAPAPQLHPSLFRPLLNQIPSSGRLFSSLST